MSFDLNGYIDRLTDADRVCFTCTINTCVQTHDAGCKYVQLVRPKITCKPKRQRGYTQMARDSRRRLASGDSDMEIKLAVVAILGRLMESREQTYTV